MFISTKIIFFSIELFFGFGDLIKKKHKGIIFRSLILILILISTTVISISEESSSYNSDYLNDLDDIKEKVVFTEGFYLKHLPDTMKQDEENLENLNELEKSEDASLLPADNSFVFDPDAKTMTRSAAELKRKEQEQAGKKTFYTPESELSLFEESQVNEEKNKTGEPGGEENNEILKYDTEQKKKQLRLRLKRKYKDIPFGPQVPHLAMVDIFGVTGEEETDPLMKVYGLESRYDRERDIEDMDNVWSSVVYPSRFTEKKVWGYDKDGNPIYSKKQWLNDKLNSATLSNNPIRNKRKIEYNFPSKFYATDGFLDNIGDFGVKSLLDKYRSQLYNKDRGDKKKKPNKKKDKEPEIIKKDIIKDSRKLFGQDKQVGWQLTNNIIESENIDNLAKDLQGVQDLDGIISIYNLKTATKQRKDAEKVFWEYFSKKKQEKNNIDVYFSLPKIYLHRKPIKTLLGWREVLFDQAIENIGKYDPRASKRFDLLLDNEEIRGIPPSRIIADMSSEAIRRPKTHHLIGNFFKGFKNYFFKRLEKKYKDYVADVLLLRAEDSKYSEMINLANKYEARQDWLSKFESPWLFIPQSIIFSDKLKFDKDGNKERKEDEYEKELLSLELDLIPTQEIDIFMDQHLKGDVLFPNQDDSEKEKEALFRKIAKETAMYNENQQYRLPHRPKAIRILPKINDYNPSIAIDKRDELNKKVKIAKKGRVLPTLTEKQRIKILEKNAKKDIASLSEKEELQNKLKKELIRGEKEEELKNKFSDGISIRENESKPLNIDNEYIYKDEGRGPRMKNPPFSTTAVSILRPKHKTIFDNILQENNT